MAGRFSYWQGTLGEAIKDDKVTMFVKVTMSTGPCRQVPPVPEFELLHTNKSSNLGTRSSTRSTLKKKSEEEEEKIVPDTMVNG